MPNVSTQELREVFNTLLKWLREGSDTAENPVDWPWDVDIIDRGEDVEIAKAFHPKAVLTLEVVADYGNGLIRLVLDPLYPTKFLDNDERLRLYYYLLKLNIEAGLVKSALLGDDDGVVFVADLDPRNLGKDEFNDTIEQLYLTAASFIKEVGWEDEVSELFMESVASIIADKVKKGASRAEIIEYLTKRVGMGREDAERLTDELLKSGRKAEKVRMTM